MNVEKKFFVYQFGDYAWIRLLDDAKSLYYAKKLLKFAKDDLKPKKKAVID